MALSTPMPNAGVDQAVQTFTLVTLDGSGSSDPDDDPITYLWEFTSRPLTSMITLSDKTTDTPSFTPDLVGTYVIELTVADNRGRAGTDTVTVTVT